MRRLILSVLVIAAILGCVPTAVDADTISPLYLTRDNFISVVQGGGVVNTWSTSQAEYPIAVDGTVRTWGALEGYTGHEYTLGGVATGNAYPNNINRCCFYDGTTDGAANYSVRYSSGDVYKFNSDWTTPTLLFSSSLVNLIGITYDPTDASLWLLEYTNGGSFGTLEHRNLAGSLLGIFWTGQEYTLALALDHADNSLWLWNEFNGAGVGDLRQYSKLGRPLSSQSTNFGSVLGGEFALTSVPDHANTSMLLLGSGLMCAGLRWRSRRAIG